MDMLTLAEITPQTYEITLPGIPPCTDLTVLCQHADQIVSF